MLSPGDRGCRTLASFPPRLSFDADSVDVPEPETHQLMFEPVAGRNPQSDKEPRLSV